jgi:predicted MFS family arabinose efflux permease
MKNKGLMFVVMYLAAVCVSLSQLKIVPILGPIAMSLQITYAQTSWLMSVFTVAGIILAVPAGGLVARFGPKKVFLAVMICMIVGNILGAICIDSYPLLLVSRIIEGCSFAMCIVAAVVFINMWFPDKNTGLFIGIFSTFAAIASVIALNAALPVVDALGITSVWWIVAGISAVVSALFALMVKEALPQETAATAGTPDGSARPRPEASLILVLRNGGVIALSIAQLVVGFILYFYLNNYPTVFTEVYGLEPATANFYGGLNGLWGIPFCVAGGFIVDRLGPKRAPILAVVSFICLAIACYITTMLNPSLYILHTLLTAAFPGLILPSLMYLIPGVVGNPMRIGYGIGVLNLFYNAGIFIGNPIVMYAVQGTGNWSSGSVILAVVSLLGLLAMLVFMMFVRKSADPVDRVSSH